MKIRIGLAAAATLGLAGLWLAPVAYAIDGSALQKGPSGYWHIVMPSDLVQSMRDSVPRFEMTADSSYAPSLRFSYPYGEHAAPFALIRDMNRDAREDVVLDGREENDRVVYLAVSAGRGYRWVLVARYAEADSTADRKLRSSGLRWRWGDHLSGWWFEVFPRLDGRTDMEDIHQWSESHGLLTRSTISCGFAEPTRRRE